MRSLPAPVWVIIIGVYPRLCHKQELRHFENSRAPAPEIRKHILHTHTRTFMDYKKQFWCAPHESCHDLEKRTENFMSSLARSAVLRFKCILELSRSQEHLIALLNNRQQSAYIFALLIDQPSRRNCISHCAGQLQLFYLYNESVEGVCVEYIIEWPWLGQAVETLTFELLPDVTSKHMLNGKNRATHKIKFVRSKRTPVVEIIKHQIVLRYSARQQKVEHTQ